MLPGRAQAFAEGLRSFPDMPEEDRSAFGILLGDLALFMQSAFALHEARTLEEETYQAYLTFFVSHIATPGGRVWWENLGRPVFTPRMVRAMDARLAEGRTLDLIGLLGTFEPDSGSSADRRPA